MGWLKQSRRIATRDEKTARNFLAMVRLAMIRRCLRVLKPHGRPLNQAAA
ncbi:MAG: transposase [Planctomycetota bacterium]|nr:transposase [Planctomycetota bacterium]